MNRYLRPALLFIVFLFLYSIPEPDILRDFLLGGLTVAVLILVVLHLIIADKTYTDPKPVHSYWIIGIAGAVLTGIFWFRTTTGSYGIETGFGIRLLKTFFFWMPAALFAVLYRSEGEGWIPGKRRTTFTRLLVAVAASLAGLAAHEYARSQIDSVPLEDALYHVERQLPEGNNRIDFNREKPVLHLDAILDPEFTEPNIHSLQRLRAIARQAADLTRRKDTDSLNLRIYRNDMKLAALTWPDPTTDRPADRLRIHYNNTGLSSIPTSGDLDLLSEIVQIAFRPKNLEASLDGRTLVLRWTGNVENFAKIPDKPERIPDIIHDWQSSNRIAIRTAGLFEGLETVRLHMPGHSVSVETDSINGTFKFQQLIPTYGASVRIQIYENEEMPELPEAAGRGPVMLLRGDGEFETHRTRVGPLWPWESTTLSGYQFYITGLEADGTVDFVIHPAGQTEKARSMTLTPGQTQQQFSVYLRNVP